MRTRQALFIAIAAALGIAAIALTHLDRSRRRAAAVRAAPVPIAEAEPVAEEPHPVRPRPAPERVGPYVVERSSDGEARILDSSGELVTVSAPFGFARLHGAIAAGGGPLLEVSDDCARPCNPATRLYAQGETGVYELFSAPGQLVLRDLDGDVVPELLLEHRVDGDGEPITLPFRLVGERFVRAPELYSDELDKHLSRLGTAAENACAQLDRDCASVLRAIAVLARFRGVEDPSALVATLRIAPEARAYVLAEETREELTQLGDELRDL